MKILFVGLGSVGQRHVRNLRALAGSGVDLIAFRTRKATPLLTDALDVDSSGAIEQTYAIRSYDRLDEALAQSPHAVFVCNPTRHHVRVATEAARAGCHLFIEKPLSDRRDGIDELIALTEQKGLVALVGYQMRFHPALRHLRALLEQRVIGDVVAVRAEIGEFLPSAHPYEDYRDSYAGRADLGGGVILSHSHELDYLRWLFGVPRRIFAVGGRLSSLEIDVEDTAGILMECVVNDRPVPVALSQDFLQRPARETCQIVGDRGTIRVDFRGPALEMFDECGRLADGQSFAGFRRNDPFLSELRHVLACFRGEETPLVTLRDAGETLRVALAARESMASGRVVELS